MNTYFGIFEKLYNRLDSFTEEGYYGPTMSDFMRETAWDQVWDIPSLVNHMPDKSESQILDLGTGDGRIIKRLFDAGVSANFIGIDESAAAEENFSSRQNQHGFSARFINANFLDYDYPNITADLAIFGSVSVNSLNSVAAVSKLFTTVPNGLKSTGRLVLSVYTDSALKQFPKLDGVLDVTPYQTASGNNRIMWRGLSYKGTEFIHNAFVARDAEGKDPVLCSALERVWSESDLTQIASAYGWSPVLRTVSSVADGGAEGFDVATLSFSKN